MNRSAFVRMSLCLLLTAVSGVLLAQTGLEIGDYTEIKVLSPDPANRDRFGSPIAMDADWLVVGATGDDEAAVDAGAVYIYLRVNGVWTFHDKLMADDAESKDAFGSDVDIIGDWMVVGAAGDDDLGTNAGAAYTYKWDGDSWEKNQKLHASEAGDDEDDFGFSVAIDAAVAGEDPDAGLQHTIVIGAPGENGVTTSVDAGAIYLYLLNSQDGWEDKGYFTPELPDAFPGDHFGFSVDIAGDGIAVGTPDDLIEGTAIDPGAVYFLQRRNLGGVWGIEWKFRRDAQAVGDELFGWSVAIDNYGFGQQFVVVGAPGEGAGVTYVYTGITNQWTEAILSPADTTNVGFFGGAVGIDLPLVVSGAPGSDFGNVNTGATYLFEPLLIPRLAPETTTIWREIGQLLASDAGQGTQMAERVAVQGYTVAAGAPFDDTAGINQGKLYLYDTLFIFANGFEGGDLLAWSSSVP